MNWLRRLFGLQTPRRVRRDTAKVRNEAAREHLRRAYEKNADAAQVFIEAARKTVHGIKS